MNDNGKETLTAEQLYSDDENINALAKLVKRIAPWAHNKEFPVTNDEIGLACRWCISMGLDPLNQHEVKIWKDKRGIKLQLAYALLCQWSTQILGGHTEPVYTRLDEAELATEGLIQTDIAFRCEFVMKEDIPLIKTMMEAGWDPLQARADLTARGLGVAHLEEWRGEYFPPKGRSRAWKVEKRAYTDAIRTRFGSPSQEVIEKMRRLRGEVSITDPDHLLAAGEAETPEEAQWTVRQQQEPEDPREPEEVLAENGELLHGNGDEI
jgi:hypothetical protein